MQRMRNPAIATIVPGSRLAMSLRHNAMRNETLLRLVADFDTLARGKHVLARAIREQSDTPGSVTVARRLRVFSLALLVALATAACGGGGGHKNDNTYARATDVQQSCCEHLSGPGRDQCLQKIVRVEDFAQKAPANQSTYACVAEHFTCDTATGHATQQSAQAQIDCIQELQ